MNRIVAVLLAALPCLTACGAAPDGDELDRGRESEAAARHKIRHVATISYAPNSFVIGNAYPGWTDDVQGRPQFSHGPGNPRGAHYRWGFLYGNNFNHCAWIDNGVLSSGPGAREGARCGAPRQIDTPHFLATYTNGIHNHKAGDGSLTHMHYAGSGCTDTNGYGNVAPWRVPATPANSVGIVPNGRSLLWRYVTKDGNWVLVRDPSHSGSPTVPNWYFVHRGCVSVANVD